MLLGTKSLLKSNIEYWMNDKFLREGLYTNVSIGEQDFYSNDISQLSPVIGDPSFKDGSVYQSAFKNWVYEPGIPSSVSGVAPPIVASGVTVNGTFYPEATTSGTYQHFIDYPNGRVVFAAPISTNSIVKASFAYKMITVQSAKRRDNENKPLLIQTAYKDNPAQTGVQVYPQQENITLPIVFFDFQKRRSNPYELGTRAPIEEYIGVFHVWTHEEFDTDIIEDILSDAQREVIIGVNYNNAPFPLLARGRKNPGWPGYSAQANIYGTYFWRRIYLDSTEAKQISSLYEIERSQISFNIKVYPNF